MALAHVIVRRPACKTRLSWVCILFAVILSDLSLLRYGKLKYVPVQRTGIRSKLHCRAHRSVAGMTRVDEPKLQRRAQIEAGSGQVPNQSDAPCKKRLLVLGGAGYVGREVCRWAVDQGYDVTSLSRRGLNPDPNDRKLAAVRWLKGNAIDLQTVEPLVQESDAVVHAIGLLFDVQSGLKNLNVIVSGSKSVPEQSSTYDNITRRTAFNVIESIKRSNQAGVQRRVPVMFVSAAEAGWPDVAFGSQVEGLAPQWLKQYLEAKRAVEAELTASVQDIRAVIFRPSLVWSWDKLDVLPAIPLFNIASALGVPFVDRTVRVTTLAKAIIAGLQDDELAGVQRFEQMDALARRGAPRR